MQRSACLLVFVLTSLRYCHNDVITFRPGAADALPVEVLPRDLIFDVYGGAGAVQSLYNVSAAATTGAGFRVVRSAGQCLLNIVLLRSKGLKLTRLRIKK